MTPEIKKTLPLYPMHISYVAKSPIWGGYELAARYGKRAAAPTIGETWELTVRDDEMSVIEDGACAGMTLGEYIKRSGGSAVGSKNASDGRFPLLIKFIDAADRLSVQVHPDDAYAARVENGVGKTEMWYVIDAAPGARLVMGLSEGKTPDDLRAEARSGGDVSDCLRYVPVSAGDCFFIPSGMVHAIGSGILIAEIQQNCDLTYRVWDYGRLGKDGKPRELHTEKACDVIRSFTDGEVEAERFGSLAGDGKNVLAACRYFTVCLGADGDRFDADGTSFNSVLCFDGDGTLEWSGGSVPVAAGESIFIPAGLGSYRICGGARVLVSRT